MKRERKFEFNETLYKKSKKELFSKEVKKLIENRNKTLHIKNKYSDDFLSLYYSPILAVLEQLLKDFNKKNILEIGYRVPLFLDYAKIRGANIFGIDINPFIENENLQKMSIENLDKKYLKKNKNKYDAIIARITLSKLYDELYEVETGRPRFKNKEKILKNIFSLLKTNGLLILQDDRGTIFTENQFKEIGFKKIINETPIIFKNKNNKSLGWNVIVAYKKI